MMTTQSHKYPTRISLQFEGKKGFVILDQIRTIDRNRLVKNIGKISSQTIKQIKQTIQEMLVD
jgi:mRNA interferase MazF